MSSEVPSKIPKVFLVEGDPILGMEAVKGIKTDMLSAGMLHDGWVEMTPQNKQAKAMSEFLNSLDGEVSIPDWDGRRKCILLRGMVDNRQFMDALLKVIQGISPTNSLVIFDEDGIIRSGKGGWPTFREACSKAGVITAVKPPFDELDGGRQKGTNQVRAVVDEVSRRGKKISLQTAKDVFLERVVPEWSYIMPEIDKLVELSAGPSITPNEVLDIVFPSAPSHAMYEFAIAFNGGMFAKTMDAYDDMVASKIDPEAIMAYSMKLIRWQLISAHLLSYGQPLPDALSAMGNRMNRENGRKRMERNMAIHPRWFCEETDEKKKKIEKFDGISPFEARGASDFVKDVFSRRMPIKSGNLGTLPFIQAAMLRYLTMFECMRKIRVTKGDPQAARNVFRQAAYKACWRG